MDMPVAQLEEEAVVLPQRQRRKRRRTADLDKPAEAEAPDAVDAAPSEPPGPGAAGESGGAKAVPADGERQGGGAVAAEAGDLDLPAYRSAVVPGQKFEYLDHTADVQLHAWGPTLEDAFASVGLCMFNYMTPLEGLSVDETLARTYEAQGHDMPSLLFNFLDELLFAFCTDFFVCKELRLTSLDRQGFSLTAEGRGERFDRERHVSGTEVKAITYSAMQILERPGDAEVFVIVDI